MHQNNLIGHTALQVKRKYIYIYFDLAGNCPLKHQMIAINYIKRQKTDQSLAPEQTIIGHLTNKINHKQTFHIPLWNRRFSRSKRKRSLGSALCAGRTLRWPLPEDRSAKTPPSGLALWCTGSSRTPPDMCWGQGLPGRVNSTGKS